MHPLIKKFWEEEGHAVIGPSIIDSCEIYIGTGPFYLIEMVAHGNMHRFNGIWYSEEEMLKLIKMKSFI